MMMKKENCMRPLRMTGDMLAADLDAFQKDGQPAHMIMQFVWTMFRDGEKEPVFYSFSFGENWMQPPTVHRLADSPLKPHVCLRGDGSAQSTPRRAAYAAAGVGRWELRDPEHNFRAVFTEDGIEVEDREVTLKLTLFSEGARFDEGCAMGVPYLVHFGSLTGTYQGKAIRGAGGFEKLALYPDRLKAFREGAPEASAYSKMTVLDLSGVREDGTAESCFLTLYDDDRAIAFYQHDGEAPVLSDEVLFHGEYARLPYVKDDSVVLQNGIFRFAGKEIHYAAKYGFRGGGDPLAQEEGYGTSAGSWYEGDVPYGHEAEFATA